MSDLGPVQVAIRLANGACIASTQAIVDVAQTAEELGFDAVSAEDHIIADSTVSPCGPDHDGDDRTVFETLQVLGFVAGCTRRVKLVTGVVILPYRNPILLAKETATLDVMSGGRLVLGVGVGALRVRTQDGGQNLSAHGRIATLEFDAFGVHGDRGPIADESLEVIDALWTQESATFHGRHVSFDDLQLYPKPLQRPRPPIWVGGRSESAQRRTARLGDGWIPSQASVEVFAAGKRHIEGLAAELGRPAPRDWGVNVYLSVGDTDEAGRRAMRGAMGGRFTADEALFSATIAGDPASVLAHIDRYRAAGLNWLDLKIAPVRIPEVLRQMEVIAREILPALREPVA